MDAFNESVDKPEEVVNADAKTDNGNSVNFPSDKLAKLRSQKEGEKAPPPTPVAKTEQIIDLVNANPIQQTGPPKVVPKPLVEPEEKEFHPPPEKDSNENVTIKAEPPMSQNVPLDDPPPVAAPTPAAAPARAGLFTSVGSQQLNNKPSGLLATSKPSTIKSFDVTSIIKDVPKPPIIFPIGDRKDEAIKTTDGGRGPPNNPMVDNRGSLKTDSSLINKIVYKPGKRHPESGFTPLNQLHKPD